MSDKNKKEDFFRNEDTLVRRAWIESALDGARASLSTAFNAPEFGEPTGIRAAAASELQVAPESIITVSGKSRPALYVAWSAGRRRSGT